MGSDRGTMRLTSAASADVTTVAKLPGGTITAEGPLRAAGDGAVSVAVVSGTGVFAGAHGTLTILAPDGAEDGRQCLSTLLRTGRVIYEPIA